MKGKYGERCGQSNDCCSWRKSARGYRSGASYLLNSTRRRMARGKKRKHRPAPAARGEAGPKKDARDRDDGWVDSLTNARFDAYYKLQGIVPDDEWETFSKTAATPLPVTFRLAGSRIIGQEINNIIREVHIPALSGMVVDGVQVEPPKVIPWYPGGLAWQFNIEKRVLRKSPEIKKFHRFLVYETENGNISRQEAVSMLPPLFLDVEPHHKVLDMCAAPGSKTAQLVEALHADDLTLGSSTPSGFIVANDSNHKRAQLLVHQLARLPTPALMVTNLDASIMPNLLDPQRRPIHYDRILCDVPCSGDGTTRKNPGIWKQWAPANGIGLHGLQVRILVRAMKLLDHHGRIVYSTCSMNPMENEAVIATVLKSNSDFELVDVSDRMPDLVRRPGMTTWKVANQQLEVFDSFEQYSELTKNKSRTKGAPLTAGHFPPEPKDAEALHLERCMRVYPHLQDTGGFFVAVLRKKADRIPPPPKPANATVKEEPASLKRALSAEPAVEPEAKRPKLDAPVDVPAEPTTDVAGATTAEPSAAPTPVSSEDNTGLLPSKPPKEITFSENPYTFLGAENEVIQECIKRLSLLPSFPSDRVFVRNPTGQAARALYMCNEQVKTLILTNDYQKIRLVHAGVKILEKQDAASFVSFRILEDGVAPILPFVEPDTIFNADLDVLKILIMEYYPAITKFEEPYKTLFEKLELGNALVRFEATNTPDATLTHSVILPLWKSGVSVCLMIDKKSKSALSFRVFGEDITPLGQKLREQAEAKAAAAAEDGEDAAPDVELQDGDAEVDMEAAVGADVPIEGVAPETSVNVTVET
ncbi:S-adenosyl-L-methionine-dependent methyltransferase [Exidia glandulosa HHB12029]|uniref:S-adenosyl-L-methionine-dependent methyltransferase n=1 Tax=Exidia glandulosa HHB12029 TaxID=1314781 RepID=A0A165EUP9_EXIGL|nr:S-adenosyl-L-methionine-dependent methyltransferase [Exidia glandulosa HHB12029]